MTLLSCVKTRKEGFFMEKRTKRTLTDEQRKHIYAYQRKWRAENADKVREYKRKCELKRAYHLVEEDQLKKEGATVGE